jgi:antagonist of KipI
MRYLTVHEAGFLTTIQDSGRCGYRAYGMPLSGAMDMYSFNIANLLAGNQSGEAALEVTLTGPVISFPGRMVIAITGADISPMINGRPVAMWKSIRVSRGDKLSFGSLVSGTRAYVAFSGGIRVPEVMGSRSTYIRGRIGGHMGRKLLADDKLPVHAGLPLFWKERKLPLSMIPEWRKEVTLSLLHGIDYDQFPAASHEILTGTEFRVTNNSDRMGIRLAGTPLLHKNGADVISYPIAPGTIQVPGDGQAVIMLSDSQTVGGYTQIAYIATADLYKTAQLKPGDIVRFSFISHEESLSAIREQTNELNGIFGMK